MRNKFIILLSLGLAACTGKFDVDVYRHLTNIAMMTRDPAAVCKQIAQPGDKTTERLMQQAHYTEIWLSEKGDDTDMHVISQQVLDEISRFKAVADRGKFSPAYCEAKIKNITPKKVHAQLDAGNVVIVAGFQGETAEGQITTLGRGGSDLTAIALAAAVKADLCQIYTDVDGVYTADPRIVPGAKKLPEIAYDEMLELAGAGAKVMQLRSVEFAKKFGVVFEVRSSLNDNPGTIVKEETQSMEGVVVRGVALDKNQAKVTLVRVPDRPGVAARVFKALAEAAIGVDMIVQNISHGAQSDISFTLDKPDLAKARKVMDALKAEVGFAELAVSEAIGKLSIVGVGMKSHSGVAAKMFETLAKEGVNIDMISTSEIKISVVIGLDKGEAAMRAVHKAFLGA